ncbi:hypothetical protein SAMN05216419_101437 [Nitrosomonas cryotolerans]|uniref:Uncharacterized protein n=1 Tax=Nitrosomonas cryotolerans ATCC 49181 TaxID=1131553 RepID=A0A1N6F5L6_9PROT|nr:hypothetical protein [Nitrosomonas cryotolerans]SFP71071.1 hypothetical protein SAMN05216419_101437 [Nitrosomonas cryotolerans]SIN90496.1 hypothetical protein SAMN02743940_0099 [Nitrosomonas cryotolerans ATCC 49181]
MKKILFFLLLLLVPVSGWADTNDPIRRLEQALARIQQEEQSTYQQFLMVQELRRNAMQAEQEFPVSIPPSGSMISSPIINYDDLVKRKRENNARIEQYTVDLEHLYIRHRELGDERKALVEQLGQLLQKPAE